MPVETLTTLVIAPLPGKKPLSLGMDTSGFVDIFLALDGLEDAFSELKHMSIAMNKHSMFESGEIFEEEFLDDGILNVEIVDAGDEE